MSETEADRGAIAPRPAPLREDRGFRDLLETLVGQIVTIVNPESYEDAPVGHQIRVGFYHAKPIGLGNDYLILATEYVHKGKETAKEPVRQYVPLTKIKRISIMKSERLIHL